MNKFFQAIALLTLSLISLSAPIQAAKDQEPISLDQIQELCENTRRDFSVSSSKDKERIQNQISEIYSLLPVYPSQKNLESLVIQVVEDTIKEEFFPYKLVEASTTSVGGKSGDPVFLIFDEQENLHSVIKAFKKPASNKKALAEIGAISLLNTISLKHIQGVDILAIALGNVEEEPYLLLLEKAAPGKILNGYIEAITSAPKKSSERQEALKKATKAFHYVGLSFAEFHSYGNKLTEEAAPDNLETFATEIALVLQNNEIINYFEKKQKKLISYLYSQLELATQLRFPKSLSHGDAHLKNMFFDEKTKKTILIDVWHIHGSLDKNNVPKGDGVKDYCRIIHSIKKNKKLTAEETASLVDAFEKHYLAKRTIDPSLLEFYQTAGELSRLLKNFKYMNEIDSKKNSEEKRTFLESVDYFKAKIA